MSDVTRIIYDDVDAGQVASPIFSFSAIDLLPTNIATADSQLDVYVFRVGGTANELLTLTTDYTIDTGTTNITLTGAAALAVGDTVTLDRDTDLSSRYLDFTGIAFLNDDNVNGDSDNLLHLIQEQATETDNSMKKTLDGSRWDAQSLEVSAAAPATTSTGLPTLGQVQNLISGSDTAVVGDVHEQAETANGVQAKYVLTGFPQGGTDDARIWVTMDGITQEPTTDYTYDYVPSDGHPSVTFTTIPQFGVRLVMRALTGSVQAVLANNSIDGTAIVDASIDESKLGFVAGDSNRFISINAGGSPSLITLTSSLISDFSTTVQATRLDEMATPINPVLFNSQVLTNVGSGSVSSDGINKGQLDLAISTVVSDATSAAVAAASFNIIQTTVTVTDDVLNTNGSSKPIHVSYSTVTGISAGISAHVVIASVEERVGHLPVSTPGSFNFWVPAGAEYKIGAPGSIGSIDIVVSTVL